MSEFDLIKKILKTQESAFLRDEIGPGDDAALISSPRDKKLVASKDLLIENVHFDLRYMTPEDVGWKSIAVNASDIFAMGAVPTAFLIGLALPKDKIEVAEPLYTGMREYLSRIDAKIYGGDLSVAPCVTISVTALGFVDVPIKRSGARAGDHILLTGPIGYSRLGLDLYRNEISIEKVQTLFSTQDIDKARQFHKRPMPPLDVYIQLRERAGVHAMIDISDGFFQDLHHVLISSNAGAFVDVSQIQTPHFLSVDELYKMSIINGGEDYQAICIVSEEVSSIITSSFSDVRNVGIITNDTPGAIQVNGGLSLREHLEKIGFSESLGFNHFT